MPVPTARLSKLELQIMEALWTCGPSAVRDVQERFPEEGRPAYNTVQTMLIRLEAKKAVRRTHKVGKAYVFEAAITRDSAQTRLIDDFLSLFGGTVSPVMAHLIQAGRLSREEIRDAERLLEELESQQKAARK
jgi:predicted transcriptional regulator